MDFYREEILDHYKKPRNFGKMRNYTKKVLETNIWCGDSIELYLKIKDKVIKEVKFFSNGCAISIASASMLSDKLIGLSVDKALKLRENNILEMLGGNISPARKKCALLPLFALKKALVNYK